MNYNATITSALRSSTLGIIRKYFKLLAATGLLLDHDHTRVHRRIPPHRPTMRYLNFLVLVPLATPWYFSSHFRTFNVPRYREPALPNECIFWLDTSSPPPTWPPTALPTPYFVVPFNSRCCYYLGRPVWEDVGWVHACAYIEFCALHMRNGDNDTACYIIPLDRLLH